MATTANLPFGAIPANGSSDPFSSTSQASSAAMRFAPFDNEQFSLYTTSSPSQTKRAVEAHLKDTDRRIQDASRLGTTLVQQRKDLAARLKDIEQVQQDNEVPADLRKKLADLEKEYNEVGKESARAFLPKSRISSTGADIPSTPSAFTGSGRESPTKMTALSRRQRNQPSNRVHDIEFATEISTSLLAQVRQLQAALAEKEDALKDTTAAKAQLEAESAGMVQRIKNMGDNEQRFKDENWNLETRLQELETSYKDSTDKEQRLAQTLKATQFEKATAQRDLDDLKVSHENLNEEHAVIKRQQETDINGLRRDVATHGAEKNNLQKKIDELTSQNTELAKAVSYRWNQPSTTTDTDFATADENQHSDGGTPEHSEPASPVKGTPRHGMLESETLKSSLNHAHRMIQNLKNNIHREKTEKIELKRMLQDARDELETRRSDSGGVGGKLAVKRRSEQENSKFKKPARPDRLGANRGSTTEVFEDEPDWEDHDGALTPSKSRTVSAALGGAAVGAAGTAFMPGAFGGDDMESTDAAFETATERGGTTDAFETSREDAGIDDSDELTETEGGVTRSGTVRRDVSSLVGAKRGDRRSFLSTASTSADEDDELRTPMQAQQPKYRLRMNNRGNRRDRISDLVRDSPSQDSPASSTGTPQAAGQSLGDELDAMEEGTPSRLIDSAAATPETQRQISVEPEPPAEDDDREPEIGSPVSNPVSPSPQGEEANLAYAYQSNAAMLAHESAINKPQYADVGVMTDPWEPENVTTRTGLKERAGEAIGSALAGFGLGSFTGSKDTDEAHDDQANAGALLEEHDRLDVEDHEPKSLQSAELQPPKDVPAPQFQQSKIVTQETKPVLPQVPETDERLESTRTSSGLQRITDAAAEPTVPLAAAAPLAVQADRKHQRVAFGFSPVVAQDLEPVELSNGPQTANTPLLPKRSSKRVEGMYDIGEIPTGDKEAGAGTIPGTDGARVGAGFFATPTRPPHKRTRSRSMPPQERTVQTLDEGSVNSLDKSKVYLPSGLRRPLGELRPNMFQREATPSNESMIPVTKPLQVRKAMADEGSQTIVSGDEIENMLRNKSGAPVTGMAVGPVAGATAGAAFADEGLSPAQPPAAIGPNELRRSIDGTISSDAALLRGPKRPASVGSMRNKGTSVPPPLPENYTQKIAAQQNPDTPGTAMVGTMGPPLMPASAYKLKRPRTPAEGTRTLSKDGTTPRAPRATGSQAQSPSIVSRQTSMSSFASEIDERFNMQQGQLMYPEGVQPATDPRMIQAITQTMIGEYLWKYTRKAGRSDKSTTRHRRFFWIHPYTRTLYWSEKDPSTAGRDMLKAKSVAIEAVRVVSDDNAYPPGLHRKSLVVVTPGREIIFTAPTGQRHETWFNALSYLLLRTEQEKVEAEDTINQEDIDEFNPGFGRTVRRTISRISGRSQSRASLSSYNSHTTRTSSPQRTHGTTTLAQRQSAAAARAKAPQAPALTNVGTTTSRHSTMRDSNGGRLSSLTSKFRPNSAQRGSFSTSRGQSSMGSRGRGGTGSDIYNASVVPDSAEDLRAVIERQEQDADRLENVRACCDGKHDVGSLPRSGRHSSLGSRFNSHSHHHSHAHPVRVPKPEKGD